MCCILLCCAVIIYHVTCAHMHHLCYRLHEMIIFSGWLCFYPKDRLKSQAQYTERKKKYFMKETWSILLTLWLMWILFNYGMVLFRAWGHVVLFILSRLCKTFFFLLLFLKRKIWVASYSLILVITHKMCVTWALKNKKHRKMHKTAIDCWRLHFSRPEIIN